MNMKEYDKRKKAYDITDVYQ